MANIDINLNITGTTTNATVDCVNNIVTLERQNAPDIDIDLSCLLSGMSTTDIFTTGSTLSGTTAIFTRNDNQTYNLDLSSLSSGGSGWSLTGNTITSGNTLGTVNNQDLVFIRNNAEVGRFTSNGLRVGNNPITALNLNTTYLHWNSSSMSFNGNNGTSKAIEFITGSGISRLGLDHSDVRFVDSGLNITKTIFGADSATNHRVEVRGLGPTSSTFGLQVHNSTGTNNALLVRDDGAVILEGNTTNTLVVGQGTAGGGIKGTITFSSLAGSAQLIASRGGAGSVASALNLRVNNATNAGGSFGIEVSTGRGLRFFADDPNTNRTLIEQPVTNGRDLYIRQLGNTGQVVGMSTISTGSTQTDRFIVRSNSLITNAEFINSVLGVTDNSSITINSSAIIDVQSTTKGFLPPRMTTAQRDAIVTPATGLMIYNTTTNRPNFFDGTNWIAL